VKVWTETALILRQYPIPAGLFVIVRRIVDVCDATGDRAPDWKEVNGHVQSPR
jgi:hypothetical protein